MPGLVVAELSLPTLISDGMVLQRNSEVPLWGWGTPGTDVYVKVGWSDETYSVRADGKGEWRVTVATGQAGGPYDIQVAGENSLTIKNVLLGEVWVCSGQSNMVYILAGSINGESVAAQANDDSLRFFQVPQRTGDVPAQDCYSQWQSCTPETARIFSAVGYYFGSELRKELGVPIGLIQPSVGGTPVDAWIEEDVLKSVPDFAVNVKRYYELLKDYPKAKKEYDKKLQEYEASLAGGIAITKPQPPMGPDHFQKPSGLYNAMIAPLVPYGLAGFIWYQGESNSWRAHQYIKMFPAMVKSWRSKWGANLPFYYVQIAPCTYYDNDSHGMANISAELREAQRLSLDIISNSGMAVTLDTVDDYEDIHPKNKKDPGCRLAKLALKATYNRDIVASGPLYKRMEVQGGNVRIYFDHVGSGLVIRSESETGFEIAGSDGRYYPASVKIEGDSLVLSAVEVLEPVAARYAWSNTAKATLFNREGLPASSFRTDNSKWETEGKLTYF